MAIYTNEYLLLLNNVDRDFSNILCKIQVLTRHLPLKTLTCFCSSNFTLQENSPLKNLSHYFILILYKKRLQDLGNILKSKKFVLVFVFLACGFLAFAHPHMFFSSTEEFVFEDDKLMGCWLEWTFDSYFSADIIYTYDFDLNGKFDAEETDYIYNYAFINLKNYYYFTFIRQGKTRSNPEKVENFSAYQKDGLLVYRFYIDLSQYKGKEIYLAVYDYTYFCDVRYPDAPVSVDFDPAKVNVSFAIEENKDYPVYYNPMGAATDTTVYYEWKPGLQTYYPREIHLTYK